MVQDSELPELVRDKRLDMRFVDENLPHQLIHTTPWRRGRMQTETWQRGRSLGTGAFGTVSLWISKTATSKRTLAIKEIHTQGRALPKDVYARELDALARFSLGKYERFIVNFEGWFETRSHLHIAMESFESGDLSAYLDKHTRLGESDAQDIAWHILRGLSYMHEAGFAHRDLKPANILIKSHPPNEWQVKIGDFGLSKRIQEMNAPTTVAGTPRYLPPEKQFPLSGHSSQGTSYAGDIWSLGETIYKILTGRHTFKHQEAFESYARTGTGFPSRALEAVSASALAAEFIKMLMNPNPDLRPTAKAAEKHAWLQWLSAPDGNQSESSLGLSARYDTAAEQPSLDFGTQKPPESGRSALPAYGDFTMTLPSRQVPARESTEAQGGEVQSQTTPNQQGSGSATIIPATLTMKKDTPNVMEALVKQAEGRKSDAPVFGVDLSLLYERSGFPVPPVVYVCIQAVDMYGLNVEYIYRNPSSRDDIQKLKLIFNNTGEGSTLLDFRLPELFFYDVNNAAGLLKLFLEELPIPLLTAEHYDVFIVAAKHPDPVVRRDSIHAIINALPDANYATLRFLVLHLSRVTSHNLFNHMKSHNLAMAFSRVLMSKDRDDSGADTHWRMQCVASIVENAHQIFNED